MQNYQQQFSMKGRDIYTVGGGGSKHTLTSPYIFSGGQPPTPWDRNYNRGFPLPFGAPFSIVNCVAICIMLTFC